MHPGADESTANPGAFRQEVRAILRLALPVALAQLGMMALGMVDVMMVGHLGKEALAAVALGHAYTFALMILGMGMLFVLDPYISQAHGARDEQGLSDALWRGVALALVLSVLFGLAFLAGGPLLAFVARDPAVVPDAHAYAKVIALGLPPFFLFLVVKQTLQAMSIVRPVIVAVVAANAVNVVLNLGFVFGRFGCPRLEAVGSAWATTCCRWFMLLVVVAASVGLGGAERRVLKRPGPGLLAPRALWPMLARGIEIGVQMALEVWIFTGVSFLMMRFGVVAMGGHTVALNLASLSFMLPLGVGAAAATRVGNHIGAGDPAAARLAARAALLTGVLVMTATAALFLGFPQPLARLYTGDQEVIAMAALLLPIAGIFQVFDGTQAVACGVLRGAGQTRIPLLVNLVGYWVLGLPGGLALAFTLGLGPRGLWWGLTIGLSSCAAALVLAIRRTFRGGKDGRRGPRALIDSTRSPPARR